LSADAYVLAAGIALAAVVVGGWVGSPKNRQGLGLLLGFLLSWLGVLIVSLIRGEPSEWQRKDARWRSSAGLIVGVIGMTAIGLAVWANQLGSVGGYDATTVEEAMLNGLRDPANQTDGYSAKSVSCVHGEGNDYSCLATFYVLSTGTDETYSYVTTCDETQCIWRPV
jgi:hypothetical protein